MEILCQDINFICEKEKDQYINLWYEFLNANGVDFQTMIIDMTNEGIMGYICTIFLYISRIDTIMFILDNEKTQQNIEGSIAMLNEMEYNTNEAIKDEKVMDYVGEHCTCLLELIEILKKTCMI